MQKLLTPVLCFTLLAGMFGCKASIQAGTTEPAPAKPAAVTPPPAQPPPAEKPKPRLRFAFKLKGEQLELPGPVVFETGSDTLRPESDQVLQIVADYMAQTPKVSLLRIEGHTDTDGKPDTNQTLSEKRAMAVARWLVAKGTKCERLIPVGFGQDRPVAPNDTEDGKAQNRRVAFVNAAMDGKPIGNFPVDAGGKIAGDPCK